MTTTCVTANHSGTVGSHSHKNAARNNSPPSASTKMYRGEIGALQLAHFPRSASHERIGIFCHHLIGELHFGQCEGGETIDSPLGTRHITTFRNEAIDAPSKNANRAKISINSIKAASTNHWSFYCPRQVSARDEERFAPDSWARLPPCREIRDLLRDHLHLLHRNM